MSDSVGVAEATIEDATLSWFEELGYSVLHGGTHRSRRDAGRASSYGDVVLVGRLRQALTRINPQVPAEAIDEAVRKILHPRRPAWSRITAAFTRC